MSSHFRMLDLPAETRSHLMTLVDARTIIRSRRISRGWKAWIDATQEIWRSIAVQWGLVSDVHAPFPTGDRRHTQGFTAIADAATASATGYFSAQTSYKVLCDEYQALSLAWSTSGAFQAMSPDAQGSSRAHSQLCALAWPREVSIVETNRCGSLTVLLAWPTQRKPDYSIVELQIAPTTDSQSALQSLRQLSDAKLLLQCGDMPAHTRLQSHLFTDGDHQFVVEEAADTCVLKDYKLQHNKSYAVCGSLSFSPSSSTGTITTMLVRWPTCAVVLQTLPIEEEARPMSATICYWDLQTRATTRTSQVEVHGRVHMIEFDLEAKLLILALEEAVHIYSTNDDRLVSRTVCHPFEFRTKDLPVYKLSEAFLDHGSTILASSQIYVCTAFLMDDKEGFKQTVIPLRWRAVEDTCLNPSCMRTDTLADFVRGYSLRPSGIVLQGSEMRPYNIQLDLASDTLITSFCWGVSLVRPFSWLSQPDLLPQVQVALVHYRLLYRRSPHVDETVAHVCDSVFSQSRICQALHEGTDGDTTYTHLVLIDLQHHRLNPLWQKKQSHFFEDVRLWHLESRSETVEEVNDPSHPGFDLDGEQPWDVVDRVRELYMDATTIYIWRAKTGLHYIDFGIAAKNASKIASAAPPKDQE